MCVPFINHSNKKVVTVHPYMKVKILIHSYLVGYTFTKQSLVNHVHFRRQHFKDLSLNLSCSWIQSLNLEGQLVYILLARGEEIPQLHFPIFFCHHLDGSPVSFPDFFSD